MRHPQYHGHVPRGRPHLKGQAGCLPTLLAFSIFTPESSSKQLRGNTLNPSCPGYTCLQPFSREGSADHRKEAQPAGSNTVASLISQPLRSPGRERRIACILPQMSGLLWSLGLPPRSTSRQDATEVCTPGHARLPSYTHAAWLEPHFERFGVPLAQGPYLLTCITRQASISHS